jgi:hypothetical protein
MLTCSLEAMRRGDDDERVPPERGLFQSRTVSVIIVGMACYRVRTRVPLAATKLRFPLAYASLATVALLPWSSGCSSDKHSSEPPGAAGNAGEGTGGGATAAAGADTASDGGRTTTGGTGGGNRSSGGRAARDGGAGSGNDTGTGGSVTGGASGGGARTGGGPGKAGAGTGAASTGGTHTGGAPSEAGSGDVGQAGAPGGGSVGIPAGLLDPDITTTWNPGILEDVTGDALGDDGLPVRTEVCQTVAPNQADELQTILNGCAEGTVVELETGTYTVPATVYVPSGVVLRGQASSGTEATQIVLRDGASGPVLAIGPDDVFDQTCYTNTGYRNAVVDLAADAAKEQNEISIAPNDRTFSAGDFALVDEENDDSIVSPGDSDGAFSRNAQRVLSQRVEIASVDTATGTLTLASPLHWTFKTSQRAQITKAEYPVTEWAGIEHVWVQGGQGLGEYLGRRAGGIDVSNAAYCWVKDVQTDGTTTGMHVTLTGTNRSVVRDSHLHNSAQYGFGQDNYGIVVRCGAADNLVENNVARYMNKPILFNNSGGGNVVGYNYADNEWSLDSSGGDQWQESSIDIHCTFPHMELVEGNWAAHVAASTTHGNGGYLTYFRNYVSSQQAADPIIWSLPERPQTGNVAALQFDGPDHHMTVIGNVLGSTTRSDLGVPTSLGTATESEVYMAYEDNGTASIFALGARSSPSVTTLWSHANFDTVNGKVTYAPDIATRDLPASLYYASRPRWWLQGAAWPWTGPDRTPMVGTLPAQAVAAAFDYDTSNNPTCTPNVGAYSCP